MLGNAHFMIERSVSCLGPHGFHRLAYRDWPGPKDAPVLICVHGLTRNARDFDTLAAALAAHYRVICPDMPGRGDSEWLAHGADYDNPLYLADIAALIARLDVERVDWVGTSMGGIIGMLLAAMRWMAGGSWNSRRVLDTAARLGPTRAATSSWVSPNPSMSC